MTTTVEVSGSITVNINSDIPDDVLQAGLELGIFLLSVQDGEVYARPSLKTVGTLEIQEMDLEYEFYI